MSWLLALLACGRPDPVWRPDARPLPPLDDAIRVVVTVDAPSTSRLTVEESVPTAGLDAVTLTMAVWTPGSYLVREYARLVETLVAVDAEGQPRAVTKVGKDRWTVASAGTASLTLRATIVAREPSVRSNAIDADGGALIGAATFLRPAHLPDAAWDLSFVGPAAWSLVTPLPAHADGAPGHVVAADYDALVDAPLLWGPADVQTFDVLGVPHRLASLGGQGWWDFPAAADAVAKIGAEEARLWGVVPYAHYDVLQVIAEGGGGLEHKESTLLYARRVQGRDPAARRDWYGLVAHELFHAWNVKRLRPVGLGPFDYQTEVLTPSLWIAEGLTAYYDDLIVRRAGLSDDKAYLTQLSKAISGLQTTPGRRVQPLADASTDAWIKHYRPDEDADNRQISYYTKGAVVGFLIDAAVREATGGRADLDAVMRLAWARFAEGDGYTEAGFEALISEVAGRDLQPELDAWVRGTEELDYGPALRWFGLRFEPAAEPAADALPALWTGLEGSGAKVGKVLRGTPAWDAGVQVGDELIGADGVRVVDGDLGAAVLGRAPGEVVSLLVARRGALRTLTLTLAAKPTETWTLQVDPDASPTAAAHRAAWLESDR